MVPLKLHARTTAFIAIDLQNAVVARSTQPHSSSDVVQRCREIAAAVREHGGLCVYVRVNVADFIQLPADAPSRDPKAPPPPASASELVPDCGYQKGDVMIVKRHWGAFIGTHLEAELRKRQIDTVIIGGLATNFGVESTARDAANLGFAVVFAEDAMATFSNEMHRFAIEMIFPRLGRVRSSAVIADSLS